jgi:hypothetical protein
MGGDERDNFFRLPLSGDDLSAGLLELEEEGKARAEGEEFQFALGQGAGCFGEGDQHD